MYPKSSNAIGFFSRIDLFEAMFVLLTELFSSFETRSAEISVFFIFFFFVDSDFKSSSLFIAVSLAVGA